MRFILTLMMLTALAVFSACETASSSSKGEKPSEKEKVEKPDEKAKTETADNSDEKDGEAPRISLADAKKDFDAGNTIFIDTRAESAFSNEHIKGAMNLPSSDFEKAYSKIPKDKKIIAYCS